MVDPESADMGEAEEPNGDKAPLRNAVIDDAEDEADAAVDLAAETLADIEPSKTKVNKCRCSLFNGQRCIEQFSSDEQDQIR
jgi:hypothetical protein